MIGFIDTFIHSHLKYNQLQQLTIDDCLRLAPFLTGLRVSSILLWLTWFWFTNRSLLRVTYEWLLIYEWILSEPYSTTDGQSVSLSWNKAHIWGLRPDFVRQLRVCWCGALSLTSGRVCRLQLLLALASGFISVPSPVGLVTVFYCLRFEASLSVASWDSQGYDGGIRPRLHTGGNPYWIRSYLHGRLYSLAVT
jgi:hypothetical protein